MTIEQYYKAPPDNVFDEIQKAAIGIWKTYDDTYGYATKKIDKIKDISNTKDNAWYIVAMFDPINQLKLIKAVSDETRTIILDAIDT